MSGVEQYLNSAFSPSGGGPSAQAGGLAKAQAGKSPAQQPAIPTAQQEALQAPAIDPVFIASAGLGGLGASGSMDSMIAAMRSMFMTQLLNSAADRNPMVGNVAGLPGGPKLAGDAKIWTKRMRELGRKALADVPE